MKVSCWNGAPLPLNTSVYFLKTVFSIINVVIKVMKFILLQYCYLIHRPYSKFTNCPSYLLYNKRKKNF